MMEEGECFVVCDFAGLLSSGFPFWMYFLFPINEKTLKDVNFY
jgi:hypothetical protein